MPAGVYGVGISPVLYPLQGQKLYRSGKSVPDAMLVGLCRVEKEIIWC